MMDEYELDVFQACDGTMYFSDEDGVFIFEDGKWYELLNSSTFCEMTIN